MTLRYVRSGASGSANGTDWANAYTTLAAALSACSAGDTVNVSEDHSESSGTAITLLATAGTKANPIKVVCVDHAGSVPPVSADLRTTAQVATTGSNNIVFSGGSVVYRGVIFLAGDSTGTPQIVVPNTASINVRFVKCSLRLRATGSTAKINVGNSLDGCLLELEDTTLSFAATGQCIRVQGANFRWRNTASALLGTIPTSLFVHVAGDGGSIDCDGVDLSAAGSGKTLIDNTVSNFTRATFANCKLDAAVTKAAVPPAPGASEIDFFNCGSSGVNYRYHRERYMGTLDDEETVVRSGGASDGTTPLAWKIATNGNCNPRFPFETPPIAIWNDITGSQVTATIEGIWGGASVPNNDDIWLEVEYLGASASPLGSFASNAPADILAANAALASSSETWGGSTTAFKLSASFTPQQKGWILARVRAAKASSTFYIDPKIALS